MTDNSPAAMRERQADRRALMMATYWPDGDPFFAKHDGAESCYDAERDLTKALDLLDDWDDYEENLRDNGNLLEAVNTMQRERDRALERVAELEAMMEELGL